MNNNHSEIQHLKNQQIDYQKWDFCVANAENQNVYCRSWFLDIVCPDWEALIYGDYNFVMPLPVISKLGIRAVLQPLHCQQLGIFPVPDSKIQIQFSKLLQQLFPLTRYQLNSAMRFSAFENLNIQKKTNYTLRLEAPYEKLYENFSVNTRRNIKKAEKLKVQLVKGLAQNDFFELKKDAVNRKVPKKSQVILNRLMARTVANGSGVIYAAYSEINTLCAAAFVLFDNNKLYYLNAFSSEEGKENRAMYAIVNELCKEFAGSNVIIDFEGSMIEGVARFYKGFGALAEEYYFVNSNKIPLLGKLI